MALKKYLLFFVCLQLSIGLTAQAEKPNFLLILSDDLTYHDLGCYGNEQVKTPHIDQLAREGMLFEYCFNSSPMCAPTRMSLYSGIHPVRNGGHPNHSGVYDHIRSMPHYLGGLDYEVALLGKQHYLPLENFPFDHLGGISHDNGNGLDLDLTKARDFIQKNKNNPWCLVVASNQSHTPWNQGDTTQYDLDKLYLPPYLIDTEETRRGLRRYYAEITYFDRQLGTVLEYLEASGQSENTVVIYLSEQGSNLPHSKWTLYDSGLRSAAIVRYPDRIAANSTTTAMIQYVDVLPTMLEMAGAEPEAFDFDGESFLPVLAGKQQQHRQYVYGVQTSRGIFNGPEAYGIRSVRNERFKLIWNLNYDQDFSNTVIAKNGPYGIYGSWKAAAESGNAAARAEVDRYQTRPEWELYDLEHDPFEMKNMIGYPAAHTLIEELKPKLQAWMEQQGDMGDLTEWSAVTRQLKKFRNSPPAPLFIDPNYHGSCDPEVVWNESDQQWYIYYTARRPGLENTWLQTPIGVAASTDLIHWEFRGYCRFDGVGGNKDAGATYWAPAIIPHDGKLHMFATFKEDTLTKQGAWGGPGRIVHYATDLNDPVNGWKVVGEMHDQDLVTIDATVYRQEDGFHLWFKGKKKGAAKNELYHLKSADLYEWENADFTRSDVFNPEVSGSGFEEAPYIFEWQGKHWLITDPHRGLFVYSSGDGENWDFQGTILEEGGTRALDNNMARHCSVAVVDDRAFIFYHVEPWRRYDLEQQKGPERVPIFKQPLKNRRSVLQVAELKIENGKLVCDRDQRIKLNE
ncbi:sulfatase-like hydrolase/transferase [Flavilitoribacter nigricans]|nr:sulfatase-like hydrolase/transferase [Flavilitoribacter nigricans]